MLFAPPRNVKQFVKLAASTLVLGVHLFADFLLLGLWELSLKVLICLVDFGLHLFGNEAWVQIVIRFVIKCDLLGLIDLSLRNVEDPVGSHGPVSTISLRENIFLVDKVDLCIVELTPLVQLVILDQREVVTRIGSTIVDTNRVQMVSVFFRVQPRVSLLDLVP